MNKNKFRVYDHFEKKFLPYSCWFNSLNFNEFTAFDRHFKCDEEKCVVQQFIGILDVNLKEIYEGDVVEFTHNGKKKIEVVSYSPDYCAFIIGEHPIMNLDIMKRFEVVGNIIQTHMYDEKGELVKMPEN